MGNEPVTDRRHEELALVTADGVQLRARYSSRPGSRAVVVVAHGFAAGRDDPDVQALADRLSDVNVDVFTYDARGHGQSEGHCGVGSTEHLDVACALSHLSAVELPVVLVGVSMGGIAVVSHLAAIGAGEYPVVGAVLVSAPARWRMRPSAVGLLNVLLTRSSVGRWAAGRWLGVRIRPGWWPGEPPESAMTRIDLPVVVVHGAADRLLSPTHARRLHGTRVAPSRLRLVEGMGHGLDRNGREAVVEAVEWLVASPDHRAGEASHLRPMTAP